jgi:acyl-CoA synthetase (AMP-forming)/AMP-acid ligase II
MGIRLPWLRRVLIAGAPVNWRILQRVKQIIPPAAEVFTPYGATEALPVTSIGSTEILSECIEKTRRGEGICVGRPIPGREVRIIRITDDPVPQWSAGLEIVAEQKGEIVVAGEVVTREYFELPAATTAAKLQDGDRWWHRMGDIGYLDEQGRLWYCGRKSHRVGTQAATLFSECCEALFNEHPNVARSALVGIGPRGRQRPVMIIEPLRRFAILGRAGKFLRYELLALASRNPITSSIREVLFHYSFPVDVRHNAKINREKLAKWAERQLR